MCFTSDLIKRHEGDRLKAYPDTKGITTIGEGFNLQAPGAASICAQLGLDYAGLKSGAVCLTYDQADAIFVYQLGMVQSQAARIFPNYGAMPETVRAVVCDLLFMGEGTFLGFHQTIAALRAGDWKAAADDLTDSLWFRQVGSRGIEDVSLLRAA
jgi:GH24 family phage-related lysozyme (muramidase)